ncbi:leucyl/phenylalanyl-tRNA--protein transferase [Arenibacter sp. M-2]|uniref:leucyl/phenylalanyl-tRNA--protein transferase n=1 Tax=unclassified Arenibacter TaxID=2615047 RepID=UPI000D7622F6|nr:MULTISPECIES: leucyl/phenylalanyl-tRNA--protein transferase [unclassified Arenibacter]MDL5511009.1 leucyl/phenylalanyl-tRNA--protein transferase [Arenibacter sp. M-2]PXX31569.1 leucyl/phenylalanyl-tRNA--protein transferase [Arenibacter sp. ARW7G5Y1]
MFFLNHRLLFPDVENADDDGLLAVGGDLSPERLLLAYRNGIFPWFNEDSMILWWSPDPRMVLFPNEIRISKSMRQVIKSNRFTISWNTQFEKVIDSCSAIKRKGQEGTWITPEMKSAYLRLYQMGIAKSMEVWENDLLVGGLYGIDLGNVFCGESMFSKTSNASKYAFICLAKELQQKEYRLIDCQVYTTHLESLGAKEIPRKQFIKILKG